MLHLALSFLALVHAADLSIEFEQFYFHALLECKGKIYAQCDSSTGISQKTIFDAGVAAAKNSGRKVLVIVGADWCPPCQFVDMILHSNSKDLPSFKEQFIVVHIEGTKDSAHDLRVQLGMVGPELPQAVYYDPVFEKVSEPFNPFMLDVHELRDGVKEHPMDRPLQSSKTGP